MTADVIALVVQAAGGALASGSNSTSQSNNASHIMLTGIFLQLCKDLTLAQISVSYV